MLHAAAAAGLDRCSSSPSVAFLYFVLPKLLGLRTPGTGSSTATAGGWRSRAVLEVLLVPRLHRAVPGGVRPRQVADRLARELPDHDGRAGGDAAVRVRRRRRDRADRVGAAALGDGAARRRLPDGRVHWPCCTACSWRTLVIVGLGLYLGVFPGGGSFALTVVPAIFGAIVIALFLAVSLLPGDFDRLVKRVDERQAGSAGLAARLAAVAGRRGHRRADRDRPGALARTRICSARSPGGALTSPCCGPASTPSAASPPKARDRHVLLRRHARQHAAAAGRDRRRRRRHDRRVHGVRRRRRAWRSCPCWPTGRSRSGCRRCPGAVAYLQLRRTVQRWQEEPVADPERRRMLSGASGRRRDGIQTPTSLYFMK